jgi:hypothetical protein
LLSEHHDIETSYQRAYLKDLDWKITIQKTNEKIRNISLHNFSIFKDQILMNQHNPLYNNKIGGKQKPSPQINKNEEAIQKLIPDLQAITTQEENFKNDWATTLNHINSFEEFLIIPYSLTSQGNKLSWCFGNNLLALKLKPTHSKNSLKKSS